MKSDEVLLFSITERRPFFHHDDDDFTWRDEHTQKMVFDSLATLRTYIYQWYEVKEKALADVVASGRAVMHMTHHLDLQARSQNMGRTNMLPEIMITYFAPSGNPRKRYMINTGNAYPIKLNPKAITE
jgi:hypothetical protein